MAEKRVTTFLNSHEDLLGVAVRCYWNLHKDCISVQTKEGRQWRVRAHLPAVVLEEVSFKVYESGRQRVLKEQRKNVHAYVTGIVAPMSEVQGTLITYNPYRYPFFVERDLQLPVHGAKRCRIENKAIVAEDPYELPRRPVHP